MLDFIGMIIAAALMVLIVNALTTYMNVSLPKITLAAVIGIWIGLAAAAYARQSGRPARMSRCRS